MFYLTELMTYENLVGNNTHDSNRKIKRNILFTNGDNQDLYTIKSTNLKAET